MRSWIIKNRTQSNSIGALFISAMAALLFTCIGEAASPQAGSNVLNYQGRVAVNGVNFDGQGLFRFAIHNEPGAVLWSNSGLDVSSIPTDPVSLTVTKGLFSVLLGDTGIANMGVIPDGTFNGEEILFLRVWFDDDVGGRQRSTHP